MGVSEALESPAKQALVAQVIDRLQQSFFRGFGESITDLVDTHGEPYLNEFEAHLRRLKTAFPERTWPDWPVDGFISFNREILREELEFKKTGRYSAGPEDFERVREAVYDDPEVMHGHYMVGLYLTYYIWPHHYEVLRFFRRFFLWPNDRVMHVMEWGVGHGLFSLNALRCWPTATGTLCDLSRHAIDFTTAVLGTEGLAGRCELVIADVLQAELPSADRIVCGELLEHVPRPDLLIRRLKDRLAPGGEAFVTAAVRAPQRDHIHLFRSEAEVVEMVESRGLKVLGHKSVHHPNRSGEPDPPRVLAMIVAHAG